MNTLKRYIILFLGVIVLVVTSSCSNREQDIYNVKRIPKEIVHMPEYKNINLQDVFPKITNKDIKYKIEEFIIKNDIENKDKIYPEIGDWINLSMEVWYNGKKIEKLTSKNNDFKLEGSSGGFPQGLIETIIMCKKGTKNRKVLKFPNKFVVKRIQGKKCLCVIKVNKIYKSEKELNDGDCLKYNVKGVKQLKLKLKKEMEDKRNEGAKEFYKEQMREILLDSTELKAFEKEKLDKENDLVKSNLIFEAKKENVSLQKYINKQAGEKCNLKEYINTQSYKAISLEIIYKAIAYKEKISVSEQDVKKFVRLQGNMYKNGKVNKYISDRSITLKKLYIQVLCNKVEEWLYNNTVTIRN